MLNSAESLLALIRSERFISDFFDIQFGTKTQNDLAQAVINIRSISQRALQIGCIQTPRLRVLVQFVLDFGG